MIQGGDPTGTGKGGESIWKEEFEDEFKQQLTHKGRGVVSMANSGPNTNQSQFFILYKSAPHLNNKHTVFGEVVGGLETLSKMERIPTENDKPLEGIKILETRVFIDSFKKYLEEEAKKKEEEEKKAKQSDERGEWFSNPVPKQKAVREGVGKYITASTFKPTSTSTTTTTTTTITAPTSTTGLKRPLESTDKDIDKIAKKQKTSGSTPQFKDFSSWNK